jgi:hypothetical protein
MYIFYIIVIQLDTSSKHLIRLYTTYKLETIIVSVMQMRVLCEKKMLTPRCRIQFRLPTV